MKVPSSFLLALVDPGAERPFHARDAVAALLEPRLGWVEEDECRAWCVGGVVGGETLVQTRPIVRDSSADFLDDLLRAPSICTVASHVSALEAKTAPGATRFHRYVGMAIGSGLDAAADWIQGAEVGLPGFVARARVTGGIDELLVLLTIARLSTVGALGSAGVSVPVLRAALEGVASDLPKDLPGDLALLITDGRKVGGFVRKTACTLFPLPIRSSTHDTRPSRSARPLPAPQLLLLSPAASDPVPSGDGVFVLDSADPAKFP
jgi:hypothetical protein